VERLEVEYLTPVNERIKYISDYSKGKEIYKAINNDGSEILIIESGLQDIRWKLPGAKLIE